MKVILAILLFAVPAFAQTDAGKFEAGAFFSGTFLRQIGSSDSGVGTSAIGIGGRVTYRALPHVDFESEMTLWPNNQATSGTWVQGLFGAKVGQRFHKAGVFATARPGFLHFRKDPFGARASSTEPVLNLGGVLEYYTDRNLIVRFDLGDTRIHYGRRSVVLSQTQPPVERGGFTTHNWQGSLGIGFRF